LERCLEEATLPHQLQPDHKLQAFQQLLLKQLQEQSLLTEEILDIQTLTDQMLSITLITKFLSDQ